jgi:hypothetical protein
MQKLTQTQKTTIKQISFEKNIFGKCNEFTNLNVFFQGVHVLTVQADDNEYFSIETTTTGSVGIGVWTRTRLLSRFQHKCHTIFWVDELQAQIKV